MKNLLLLALAIALFATGCKDDEQSTELRYDNDNSSAPILDQDVYEAAVRFPGSLTTPYAGMNLTEVEFYILDRPGTCAIVIYDEGNSSSPGTELYRSGDLVSSLDGASWNTHTLPSPIVITGDDLWISVEVSHIQATRSVGCDTGPAKTNGDWLYSSGSQEWQTLRDFTSPNVVNINWNIRGILTE